MKKILMLLMVGIFLISFASAWDWDNVQSYDEEKQEYEIDNALGLGANLATLQLKTPRVNMVIDRGVGIMQKVAEIEFTNWVDIDGSLAKMETYNTKDLNTEINRYIEYRYKKITTNEVQKYEIICTLIGKEYALANGTITQDQECTREQTGIQPTETIEWIPFTEMKELPSKRITIGLFTDVKPNDKVEWIPNWYGERLTEWATWTEGLNTNLVTYHTFDDADLTGSTSIDVVAGLYNGTIDGATTGVAGKLGEAYSFDGTNDDVTIGVHAALYGNAEYTLSVWAKIDSSIKTGGVIVSMISGTPWGVGNWFTWMGNGDTNVGDQLEAVVIDGGGQDILTHAENPIETGVWKHLVLRVNATHSTWIINGSVSNIAALTAGSSDARTMAIGDDGGVWGSDRYFKGDIDEVAYWGRALSDSEISDLYNDFDAITYITEFGYPSLTLNSPADNSNVTTDTITFNYTCEDDSNVTNVTLYINDIANVTTFPVGNESNIATPITFADGNYNWSVDCYDDATPPQANTSATRIFGIDTTDPSITLINPTMSVPYGKAGNNVSLNYSITDTNQDSCWYQYDGSNVTLDCTANDSFISTIQQNITLYGNDSFGNIATSFNLFEYKIWEESQTYNATVTEGDTESFFIEIVLNESYTISSAFLNYNNTNYTATGGTPNLSVSVLIPDVDVVLNNSFYWIINLNDSTMVETNILNQTVSPLLFRLCDATLVTPFINITFKNETTAEEDITAQIVSSWTYWGASPLVNETYALTNTTEHASYEFCASPNVTFSVNPSVTYENAGSVSREYTPDTQTLTNTVTNLVLWLLPTADGQYVTFQIVDSGSNVIEGALVNASTSNGIIESKLSDGAGLATLFLEPTTTYTICAAGSGYVTSCSSIAPSQTQYTITLTSTGASAPSDYTRGITYSFLPSSMYLENNTDYPMNFTVTSTYWTVEEFGFNLYGSDGNVGGDSSTGNGGVVNVDVNTGLNQSITMQAYWTINSTIINVTRIWSIQDTGAGDHSINNFFTRLDNYLNNESDEDGLFGLTNRSGNNFGISLVLFIIIFMFAGILSYRYGLTSPVAILGVIFTIVYFFDVVLELLPRPLVDLPYASIITFIILMVFLVKEVSE